MKYYLIFSLAVTASLLFPSNLSAQTLTNDDKELVTERIIEKVENFIDYLEEMADKKIDRPIREKACELNKQLFIGNCEPYETYDMNSGRSTTNDAVKILVSSTNRPEEDKFVKDYLWNILNDVFYSNIKITQAKAIRLGEIKKVGDGRYEGIAYICQDFVGIGDNGRVQYSDRTWKKVRIHIDYTWAMTREGLEFFWDVRLGDIQAIHTSKI